jgi:CCR4-NOT transcription complex subunit 7/8
MMTLTEGCHGGLGALAESLQVERIGPMHQAGSDSLLTAQTFFSLINRHFNGICDDAR